MGYNFNNYTEEYSLFRDMTEEQIDLFGLEIKYVKSTNQNMDMIFGEFTHKKLKQDGVVSMFVLPENSEEFDGMSVFGKFGFIQNETFNCFVSAKTLEKLGYESPRTQIVGDIIVLPNGKKFEVTFVEHEVKGMNNMFPYANQKNVYMMKTHIWNYNIDEKEAATEVVDTAGNVTITDNLSEFDFTKLDIVFNTDKQDNSVPAVDKKIPERILTQKEEASFVTKRPNKFGDWD